LNYHGFIAGIFIGAIAGVGAISYDVNKICGFLKKTNTNRKKQEIYL
jgi:hypothetical protein